MMVMIGLRGVTEINWCWVKEKTCGTSWSMWDGMEDIWKWLVSSLDHPFGTYSGSVFMHGSKSWSYGYFVWNVYTPNDSIRSSEFIDWKSSQFRSSISSPGVFNTVCFPAIGVVRCILPPHKIGIPHKSAPWARQITTASISIRYPFCCLWNREC